MTTPISQYEEITIELRRLASTNPIFQKFLELAAERDRLVERSRDFIKENKKNSGPFRYSSATQNIWNPKILKDIVSDAIFREITEIVVDKTALAAAIKKGKVTEKEIEPARSEKVTDRCLGPQPWKIEIE